jgi:RND family efflux transporter MFP subunit
MSNLHLQMAKWFGSFIALLTTLGLVACSPKTSEAPIVPAVYVDVIGNDLGNMQRKLFGIVQPRVESELAFRIGGKVAKRLVDVGAIVRKGQVLAKLDQEDVALALEAALQQQRQAEVDAVQAANDAARFQKLVQDGSVGVADAERQQARADAAAARLEQAIKQAALARNQAGYAVLLAPFDGAVTQIRIEEGQVVNAGQPVLGLARPNELEVQVDVPESMATELKDWTAIAHIGEPDAKDIPLRLREISPIASRETRTYRARFAFATKTPPTNLLMGKTAYVLLQRLGQLPSAELPIGALLMTASSNGVSESLLSRDTPMVWVVEPNSGFLQARPVQWLSQTTNHVRVSGLADGELVVTVGAQTLDAGLTVRPIQRPLAERYSTINAAIKGTDKP